MHKNMWCPEQLLFAQKVVNVSNEGPGVAQGGMEGGGMVFKTLNGCKRWPALGGQGLHAKSGERRNVHRPKTSAHLHRICLESSISAPTVRWAHGLQCAAEARLSQERVSIFFLM